VTSNLRDGLPVVVEGELWTARTNNPGDKNINANAFEVLKDTAREERRRCQPIWGETDRLEGGAKTYREGENV